jgi:trehalose 6-phosphate synthase
LTVNYQLVVVANRLPVRRVDDEWQTSPGGLVRALVPILVERDGAWVGWAGVADEDTEPFRHGDIDQVPVPLSEADIERFYLGYCNGTLWPLYHDGLVPPQFHRRWWAAYSEVNRRYAERVVDILAPDGVAWVQDYQLQLVPQMVRERRPEARIGFYLHIPFPPVELFSRLPSRKAVLEGLLGADVVAFQTRRSAANFIRCAIKYAGARSLGKGRLAVGDRVVRTQRAPIGIDPDEFRDLALSAETQTRAKEIRAEMGEPDHVILGVDRLDYTKGIDLRLKAFDTLLGRTRDSGKGYEFVQVAVPSREGVPAYQQLRDEIDRTVGRINGDYATPGRAPVHYLYRSLPLEELVAFYVAADVMLVTPLRDGMNLVAKEYVACRPANDGALILSEFAGAAEQLRSALLVNPYDVDSVADTIAYATEMSADERTRRMKALSRTVRRDNVFRWAAACLEALGS